MAGQVKLEESFEHVKSCRVPTTQTPMCFPQTISLTPAGIHAISGCRCVCRQPGKGECGLPDRFNKDKIACPAACAPEQL